VRAQLLPHRTTSSCVRHAGAAQAPAAGADPALPRAERHADASSSAPHRAVTAVLYLNPGRWDAARDGGELRLFNHNLGACVPPQPLSKGQEDLAYPTRRHELC